MGWQKIDDQFGVSQKVIRIPRKRRQQVVGLWTLAGNYAARVLTDGRLEAHELDELDARKADVDELVRVGLWHRHGVRCTSEHCSPAPEDGVTIHDYLRYNPSRAEVEAAREAERVRKAAYRESKRRPSGTPEGTPVGSDSASEHPVPSRPVPYDLTKTSESSPDPAARETTDSIELSKTEQTIAGQMGITRLQAIADKVSEHTGRRLDAAGTLAVCRHLLDKAPPSKPPRVPQRYVIGSIARSPFEVQQFIDEHGLAA